jgi:hypothetical protein
VAICPHTAEPSFTIATWLTLAGRTRESAGGSTTHVNTWPRVSASESPASTWPRGVLSMPARTISPA